MAVSVSLRFNVFKRDGFTCQYCGRKTPVVILEADHIVPKAAGGPDEIENLVTSCWDCNRGKGAVPLGVLPESVDPHDRAIEIAERERQLREYNEVRRAQQEREDRDIEIVQKAWKKLTALTPLPAAGTIRTYLRLMSVFDILHAVENTAEAVNRETERKVPDSQALPYLFGTLRRKAGERVAN